MKSRRWFRKLYLFYKLLHSKSPSYLLNLIPENNNPHASRSAYNNQIPFFNVKTNFLKNSFLPAVKAKWNNPDISIRNSSSCHIFKNLIRKFVRLEPNRISSTQKLEGLKLLTRMTLGLSHLADHKFRHNFQDCLKPICSCGKEIETLSHFLLISNNSSIAGMFSYKLTFSFVVIFLLSTFSLVYCFICHLGTMWSSVNSFSL